jgi:hypothetical protein
MKRYFLLIVLPLLFFDGELKAQYWVEFNPGTCQVGPPPTCVAGHWYWVEVPSFSFGFGASSSGAGPGATQSGQSGQSAQTEEERFRKPTEISTDLEYETFSRKNSVEGRSLGLRGGLERSLPSNFSYGFGITYEKSKTEEALAVLERSPSIFAGNVFIKRRFEVILVSVGYSYSNYKGDDDVEPLITSGPFASVSFNWFSSPFLIGGGFSYQRSKTKFEPFVDESNSTTSFGINTGFELGKTAFITGEFFRLKEFSVVGATLSKSISQAFALTLGYKKALGLEDFSNNKFTLGSSFRF